MHADVRLLKPFNVQLLPRILQELARDFPAILRCRG